MLDIQKLNLIGYNGATVYFKDNNTITINGKIISVEHNQTSIIIKTETEIAVIDAQIVIAIVSCGNPK